MPHPQFPVLPQDGYDKINDNKGDNNDDVNYTTINDDEYRIIRKYNFGRNLNVFKAYKKPIESVYYIIKIYDDIISYKREIDALIELKNAKNIMRIVDYDSYKMVIVGECGLYDLEIFFEHQAWTQRQVEKVPIVKDIVAALSQCQHLNIVHLDLTPKNIMCFRDETGENWKLIDFDTACTANTYVTKTSTPKYCCPELIEAENEGKKIKAQFSMDMFSFGLILHYIENGYWNTADQKCTNIGDPYVIYVIESLLEKNVNKRMTLAQFMDTVYYKKLSKDNDQCDFNHVQNETNVEKKEAYQKQCKLHIEKEAKELNPDIKGDELKKMNVDLQQEQFITFLERYHQEMKISLKEMNAKIDECKNAVLNLTETIPRLLIKIQNEKTPRTFIMVPERREFKNPITWYTNPFKMYFVCEHNNHWHIPKQDGFIIKKVPEFIKKYGPWIQLCIQALVFGLRVATSNLFPKEIGDILEGIFNIKLGNNDKLLQHFQEIIDTVGVGVKEIIDDSDPNLVPLDFNGESNYQIINASGIRALASFLKSQPNSESYGGLVQCIDRKTQNVLWLCDEHRNDNDYTHKDEPQSPHSSNMKHQSSPYSYYPPRTPTIPTPPITPTTSYSSHSSHLSMPHFRDINNQGNFESNEDYSDDQLGMPPNLLTRSNSRESSLTDISSPFPLINLVNEILLDVFNNASSSECLHFKSDEIQKETHNMRENLMNIEQFYQNWHDDQQKKLLKNILKRIIKATNALNEFYGQLTKCLENKDQEGIKQKLNKLDSSSTPLIKISLPNKLMKDNALKEWYIIRTTSMIYDDDGDNSNHHGNSEDKNNDEYKNVFNDILVIKNRVLKGSIPVFGKELDSKCFNHEDNINCIEKEIYMYSERGLNNSDNILKFLGFTVEKFKPILHYEYANYGNLYDYLKKNKSLPENNKLSLTAKLNLSLEICAGLEFLHKNHILHLDLRSSNIFLFKNKSENEFPNPKISNFLYSVDALNNQTIVKPHLPSSIDNKVRKRWHEPQRLKHESHSCTFESDYYSLGMLLWEIFNATGALPYAHIEIAHLYEHLVNKNGRETFPRNLLPSSYNILATKITKSWQYNIYKRTTTAAMIATLRELIEKKKTRTISALTGFSFSSEQAAINQLYFTKAERVIQKYREEIDVFESHI